MNHSNMNNLQFNYYVDMLRNTFDKHSHKLNLHYVMIHQNNQTWLHQFKETTSFSDVRSLSKTIMTILLGYIIEHEPHYGLSLDTYVYPILKDHITLTNSNNLVHLKQIQIKHLLTHTMGYEDVLLMRQDIQNLDPKSLVNYLINYPLVHAPGTYYLYSNAGFYLLSVFLQIYLNQDLNTYLQERLFKDLDITDYKWERYGDYLAGATRLWLYPKDLMKIGLLLLHDGMHENQRIISSEWITIMKTKVALTPLVDQPQRLFRRYAYGHGIWLAKEKGIFFGLGTDGQSLIIVPHLNMVILSLAQQSDTEPLEKILNQIIEDI